MKTYKKIIICLLGVAVFGIGTIFSRSVWADGGMMIWPPTIQVQQTDQNAIVAWNGVQEVFVLSTNLEKPAGSQAATLLHVVPLPSQPADIKEEDPAVFDKLTTILNQKIAAMQSQNANYGATATTGMGGAKDSFPSVEIVMQKTIGAHDITVVKVNTPADFYNWIDGFASGKKLAQKEISAEFKNGLQSYLKRGINYFVFDVLDLSDPKTTVKPLVYQFDTRYFFFPLLISGISEIGASQANVNLFLVFNKDWKLPAQIWPSYGDNYSVYDSNLDIALALNELKGISARTALIFNDGVKVRRFSMSGKLSDMNKDLMLFPRILSSNLKIGMANNDVKNLQQLLINEGFWEGNGGVTGYFGLVTKQAVMKFQEANKDEILKPLGLTQPTGFFGPYTRNYLNNNIFIDNEWSLNCGNGKCDNNENSTNCPWDCKPSEKSTCNELCTNIGRGDGDCVTSTAGNLQCGPEETDLGYNSSDCNLYGSSKNSAKACCCKTYDSVKNCIKEGEQIFDPNDPMYYRRNRQCCSGLTFQKISTLVSLAPAEMIGFILKIGGLCVDPNKTGNLECKKGVDGKIGWYYSANDKLVFEANCFGTCGNGACEIDESAANCPQDCK